MAALTLHNPDTVYSFRHGPSWMMLAAAAGMVNGLSFQACKLFVSHVTGTFTQVGLQLPGAGLAAEFAAVLGTFALGGVLAILLIEGRARTGHRPWWPAPLVVDAGLLVTAALLGWAGAFGPFGAAAAAVSADPDADLPVTFLCLMALAMGIQNAAVASTTGLAVRTTHLTGPLTDLGTSLGVALLTRGKERRTALRGATLRAGKIVAFVVGVIVSVPLTRSAEYLGLLVPAGLVLVGTALSFAPDLAPEDYSDRLAETGQPEKEPGAPGK